MKLPAVPPLAQAFGFGAVAGLLAAGFLTGTHLAAISAALGAVVTYALLTQQKKPKEEKDG